MKNKTILTVLICTSILTLSCGMMSAKIYPPVLAAPVPARAKTESRTDAGKQMTVCNSGGLNVRVSPNGTHAGVWLIDGQIVTVTGAGVVTEDMGLWIPITEGWVNARYLCEVE